MSNTDKGFVTYQKVENEYFSKRGLKRYAGVWSLWALGVGAVIAYAMQCLAFIILRVKHPNIDRPYRSPLGIPGALIALIISLFTLCFLFLIKDNLYGVIGMAIWFFVGVIYFALYGRHRLVFSPEEQFALDQNAISPEIKHDENS